MSKNKQSHRKRDEVKNGVSEKGLALLDGYWPCLWLLISVGLVYGASVRFGLINYDDAELILKSQSGLNGLSGIFQRNVFLDDKGLFLYRPVLSLSFIIDAMIAGTKPWIYHLSNVAFHALTVLMIFRLFLIAGHNRTVSFMGGLLFSVHPAISSAVAWIPGRNDVLLGLFLTGAFYYLIDYFARGRAYSYILTMASFALALFTKENALVFPLLAVAYVFLTKKESSSDKPKVLKVAAGWGAVILLWFVLRAAARSGHPGLAMQYYSFPETVRFLWAGWGKLFLPLDLSFVQDVRDLNLLWGVISTVIFAIVSIAGGVNNKRVYCFGLIWFFVFWLPVSAVRWENNALMEHRLYVPFIGVILSLLELKILRKPVIKTLSVLAVAAAAIVTFGFIRQFKDDLSCWTKVARKSPQSAFANNALGDANFKRQSYIPSERCFLNALKLKPQYAAASFNLGTLYLVTARENMAKQYLTEAVRLNPGNSRYHYNLAQAYERLNEFALAGAAYEKTAVLEPGFSDAHVNLGVLYQEQKQYGKAMEQYQKALTANPGNIAALINLGLCFQGLKKYDEAERAWNQALTLNPKQGDIYYRLGAMYQEQGQKTKAELAFDMAFKLQPGLKNLKHTGE